MRLQQLFDILEPHERARLLRHVAQTLPASALLTSVAEEYDSSKVEELQDLAARLQLLAEEMRGMGL